MKIGEQTPKRRSVRLGPLSTASKLFAPLSIRHGTSLNSKKNSERAFNGGNSFLTPPRPNICNLLLEAHTADEPREGAAEAPIPLERRNTRARGVHTFSLSSSLSVLAESKRSLRKMETGASGSIHASRQSNHPGATVQCTH